MPLDRFVVTCPNIAQSDWTLGDSDKLAVVVPEGSMRLDANLRIKGERLTGDVLLRRVAGAMKPVVSQDLGGQHVAGRIADVLKDTGSFEMRLVLSGTVADPKYQLQTELGDRIADAFESVAKAELKLQKKRLEARVNREVDLHVAKFQQTIQQQQKDLGQQLALNQDEVDKLARLAGEQLGISNDLIRDKLG